jgi:hypothetical protein
LDEPWRNHDPRAYAARGIARDERVGRPLARDALPRQRRGDPAEIVGVVDADGELVQPAPLGVHESQLVAARGGREHARRRLGETELPIEPRCGVHVGHAHRQGHHAMQAHQCTSGSSIMRFSM